MNWSHFKRNTVGLRCQVEPIASFFSDTGSELTEVSDDWEILGFVDDTAVQMQNCRTGHQILLGKDHLFDYRTNPGRSDAVQKYGFLILKVHVLITGDVVTLRPNSRPGERAISVQRRRVAPIWTAYVELDLQASIPPIVNNARIQFRLWSEDPDIPLMIRVAHDANGRFQQESSGPSGIIETMVGDSRRVYVSFSHPELRYEIGVSGFKYE